MANFKRKKTRRQVRCTLCTKHRWRGNGKERFKPREEPARVTILRELRFGPFVGTTVETLLDPGGRHGDQRKVC